MVIRKEVRKQMRPGGEKTAQGQKVMRKCESQSLSR